MPNVCVKCGKVHKDDAEYLLKSGCDVCGSKFFFFVRNEHIKSLKEELKEMDESEIKEIEKDMRHLVEEKKSSDVIILDIESVRAVKPGKYLLDLTKLFNQRPIVIRIAEGKYRIDLSSMNF